MTNKLRILQVIKTLDISGAERYGVELARFLTKLGCEVEICSFFKTGSPLEAYWQQQLQSEHIINFSVAPWKGNNHFLSYLAGIKNLREYLKQKPVDIIHSHFQLGSLIGLEMRKQGLTRSAVRTAHNHPRNEWAPSLYGWLCYKLIGGWLYPMQLDAETAVSAAITDELSKTQGSRFVDQKPTLIYNGISPDLITQANAIPRRKGNPDKFFIGSIGRLSPQKDYASLLKAIHIASPQLKGLEAEIIGDGELRLELEEQRGKLGLDQIVHFRGRQNNVLESLRRWDLFILPSLWEGLPTVVLESMCCQTPILATDIPGTREIISHGKTGWLVPPGDPIAMANHLIQISKLSEAERATVTNNSLIELQKFTYPNIALQMLSLYHRILKE